MHILLLAVLLYVGMVNDEKEAEKLDQQQKQCMMDKMEDIRNGTNKHKLSCEE